MRRRNDSLLTSNDRAKLYVEMWKQTVDVQEHFNDIEMRIRTAAITILTFVLGGASLALPQGTQVSLWSHHPQLASLVLVMGALLWAAFYFVDQWWYHPLLLGAVKHGETLECELQTYLPKAGLTLEISKSSPFPLVLGFRSWKYKHEVHSKHKMTIFYGAIFTLLLVSAVGLQFAH